MDTTALREMKQSGVTMENFAKVDCLCAVLLRAERVGGRFGGVNWKAVCVGAVGCGCGVVVVLMQVLWVFGGFWGGGMGGGEEGEGFCAEDAGVAGVGLG